MARNRVRMPKVPEGAPKQSIAGYYPKDWKRQPANINRKPVTADEALQALANHPGAYDERVRIYIYGVHQSRPQDVDVKASAGDRGPMRDALEAIDADVAAYRAQANIDARARYSGSIPYAVELSIRRDVEKDVRAYEQSRMVQFATDQMGYDYKRVLGVWIA